MDAHVVRGSYSMAEVVVLASSPDEALDLMRRDGAWNADERARIAPMVIPVDRPQAW